MSGPGWRSVRALDEGRLDAALRRHPKLFPPGVVQKLTELAREKLRVNAQESLRLAETALHIARVTGGPRMLAFALRADANALWFLNRNQAAVERYGEAAAVFEEIGDDTEVGRTLSSSIQPLIRLGEYARALQGAERARGIFQKNGDALRQARLNLNVANIFHRQDRFQEAFDIYERTYQELVPFKDSEGMAAALHNMAVCLIVLNDFHKALAVYGTARDFCQANGMPALAAQADYNIAYLYYFRGDYTRALEMLREARRAAENTGDAYHRSLCYMDQSEIYLELNMHEEAAETAQEAFTGFQALGIGYESGKSLANLAIARGRMGKVKRSIELFSQARELFVREGNPVWPSLLDLYQALVLYQAGRYSEARRLGSAALRHFHSRNTVTREILCHLLLARIALASGGAGAQTHAAAAMRLLRNLEAPHLRHQAYFVQGQVAERQGDAAKARKRYRAALEEAESLRSFLRGDELKIGFTKGTQEVYEGLVKLCLDAPDGAARPEEAFAYMEQAKSRSLRDLVAERPLANRRHSAPSAVQEQLLRLKEELNWYYHRLEVEQAGQEAPSNERLAALERQAQERERELAALLRDLPPAEAESAGVPAAGAFPLDAIRAALGPGRVLVEYFRVGDRFVAAVVSAAALEIVPLGRVDRIEELAQLLRFQFSKFQLGPEYVKACHAALLEATGKHLQALYSELFAPLEERVGGSRGLILAPHEGLHHLPLHALFDGKQYLMDRFAISYTPSASVLVLCTGGEETNAGRPLILGVPDPRAPMIEDEVRAVAEIVPQAELLVGPHATRQALEEKGPHSQLLHIATHGRFREDRPMFSAIRLGDGYLTLHDLYGLSLPVDLAALSGCSTGRSVVAGGDELLGLIRGLLHAGARSVLLTLWDVQDRSTATFMESFYRRLTAGAAKAAALRESMMELRKTHPHPYYWAPFVLSGRP